MYHVNDENKPGPCRAKTPERCKFHKGVNDPRHYETEAEAIQAGEDFDKAEFGGNELESKKVVNYDYAGIDPKERTAKLAEDLENAIDEIIASGDLPGYFNAMARNGATRWSFNNVVIAGLQLREWKKRNGMPVSDDYLDEINNMDACGAKQGLERGRKVNSGKGSALYILAPLMGKRDTVDQHGQPVLDDAGKPKTSTFLYGYRTVAVFDKSQTEGEPIPENPISIKPITKEVDQKYIDDMKGMVSKLGFTYSESEIAKDADKLKGTLGYTEPGTKSVVVDSRLSNAQKASVIAHELAHIQMGHTEDIQAYKTHRGQMETEAEGLAYMMMRRMGLDAEESKSFSPGYIAGWAKGDKALIKKALNKVTSRFGKITEELGG